MKRAYKFARPQISINQYIFNVLIHECLSVIKRVNTASHFMSYQNTCNKLIQWVEWKLIEHPFSGDVGHGLLLYNPQYQLWHMLLLFYAMWLCMLLYYILYYNHNIYRIKMDKVFILLAHCVSVASPFPMFICSFPCTCKRWKNSCVVRRTTKYFGATLNACQIHTVE